MFTHHRLTSLGLCLVQAQLSPLLPLLQPHLLASPCHRLQHLSQMLSRKLPSPRPQHHTLQLTMQHRHLAGDCRQHLSGLLLGSSVKRRHRGLACRLRQAPLPQSCFSRAHCCLLRLRPIGIAPHQHRKIYLTGFRQYSLWKIVPLLDQRAQSCPRVIQVILRLPAAHCSLLLACLRPFLRVH